MLRKIVVAMAILLSFSEASYQKFKKEVNPKSYKVFEDTKLLKKANPKNTKILVNISKQRIKLLVNDKVAIDAPATTGRKYKNTPKGTFKITEKIKDKRSTIFGKIYKNGKLVYKGDRRKYKGKGRYEGALLKNWMRLTSSGIGIHGSSYIHRFPKSNGCIRVPYNIVSKIFQKVGKGTTVKVVS